MACYRVNFTRLKGTKTLFVNENTYSSMNLQGGYYGTVSVTQFVWVSGGDHGYK